MSLQSKAKAKQSTIRGGRPGVLVVLRAGLTPKQRKDFDETMADSSLSASTVASAIKEEYGVHIGRSAIATWRRGETRYRT